ncbi:hypothetical protein [Lysobacter sp. Root604]|uniref:hypothetical protein n=1 Tax=Lysobacter sp. Root604 TaxID=1736568 RepID=UPI0006FBD20E|nr:hypothetical protein [Lysobacter sp. Root604]KRA20811.1 hypothetical protein ASD69_05765 [Lysobacter sp. Root604]
MFKDYALFNLAEAKQAIEQLMAEMQSDPDYDDGSYLVDMQHIYWHLNSAWNGRNFDSSKSKLTNDLYDSFIQFPTDIDP